MRRLLNLRRSIAATAVSMLLLALTSCGSDEEPVAGDPSSPTSATTESEATEEPTEDEGSADGEAVDKAEFVAYMEAGLEAATTAHMSMTTDFGMGALEAEGQVDYTRSPVAMAMTMANPAMSQEPMELRLIDNIMYMNMGSMSNDKFIRYDLADPDSQLGPMGQLTSQMDPLAAFDSFATALTSATFVGAETVDGEELQHYLLVLDTAKVASLKDVPGGIGLPPEVEYDLWFDDANRIRHMHMVMEMATTIEVDAKIFDWDEPVEIEAPPADEVIEPPES